MGPAPANPSDPHLPSALSKAHPQSRALPHTHTISCRNPRRHGSPQHRSARGQSSTEQPPMAPRAEPESKMANTSGSWRDVVGGTRPAAHACSPVDAERSLDVSVIPVRPPLPAWCVSSGVVAAGQQRGCCYGSMRIPHASVPPVRRSTVFAAVSSGPRLPGGGRGVPACMLQGCRSSPRRAPEPAGMCTPAPLARHQDRQAGSTYTGIHALMALGGVPWNRELARPRVCNRFHIYSGEICGGTLFVDVGRTRLAPCSLASLEALCELTNGHVTMHAHHAWPPAGPASKGTDLRRSPPRRLLARAATAMARYDAWH